MIIILSILLFVPLIIFLKKNFKQIKRIRIIASPFPDKWESILIDKVIFYKNLNAADRQKFRNRIKVFLKEVHIAGVGVEIDDQIRLLVASSAIIPIFSFDQWDYVNLKKVSIYNDMLEAYHITDNKKENIIIDQMSFLQSKYLLMLSKKSLERGFEKMLENKNAQFQEFALLVDAKDNINEVTSIIMPPELIRPWIHLMYREIEKIKLRNSDINFCGINNHAAFFAIVCEYFFENPKKFEENHRELHQLLSKTFKKNKKFF
jgi:MtfA peptidase